MDLTTKVNDGLKQAMKDKDDARKRTLRAIKAAFTILATSGRPITEDSRIATIRKMEKERMDSAKIYTDQQRFDLANPELEEIRILREFIPAQMDEETLRNEVSKIINEIGAESMRDMGRVMKEARNRIKNADGKLMSTIVKELLS